MKHAGCLLVVLGSLLIGPHLLMRDVVSSQDIDAALAPLAQIPLRDIGAAGKISVEVVVPGGAAITRAHESMGGPEFLIVPVNATTGRDTRLYTRQEAPLEIIVKGVDARPADLVPYGYSAAGFNGLVFRGEPGTRARIVVRASGAQPTGTLAVLPVWRSWVVSDHLNVALFAEEYGGRARSIAMMGGIAIVLGAIALMRSRRGSTAS